MTRFSERHPSEQRVLGPPSNLSKSYSSPARGIPANPFPAPEPRFESAPYDHGFKAGLGAGFEDLDEALIHAALHRHENGRVTSFTGRNQRDITWAVRDKATGSLHYPGTEHIEAARLLYGPHAA